MSGFEVAGVVLGSIPIVVSALEFYIKGLGTMGRWRRFTVELNSLVLKLRTEEAKLQNVCEKLLRGIVDDDHIYAMLQDPLHPMWTEPKTVAHLRRRLWRHLKLFEENVKGMDQAMGEMRRKLGIGAHGKKHIKRIMFVLQQDEYQSLLRQLREGVSSLEDLVSGNMELEAARCRASQVKWYRLLQDLSTSIYEALRASVTCACPGLHDFGLRLMSQPTIITPLDEPSDIAEAQKFFLVLSYAATALATEANLWAAARLWNLLSLSPSSVRDADQPCTVGNAPTTNPGRNVGLTMLTPEGSQMSEPTQAAVAGVARELRLETIQNLCRSMRKSRKQGIWECCGHISDLSTPGKPRRYEVYPLGSPNSNGNWTPVSLASILGREGGKTLMLGDRIRLAWVITSSLLQLGETPWLPRAPSRNDIFLTQQDEVVYTADVFIMKKFPVSAVSGPTAGTMNVAALKALGVLLVELVLGQAIDRLHSEGSIFGQRGAASISDYDVSLGQLHRINTIVGPNYCSAVKRCINCEYFQSSLDFDDTTGKSVLVTVLDLLERDLKNVMGG
ncbi:hypothetical protein QBC47DRAFT_436008 [Echria macrotheca]|uniref:Uncharacterized protein n=1 Tax=Echria macrotheca TaxID=438768 RepID=A0AAJ0BIC8_9PEZI|nr:hypothetical protein QBC47DRAFT_436008 [Echria macrotheca]